MMGQYDAVVIVDALNDETMAKSRSPAERAELSVLKLRVHLLKRNIAKSLPRCLDGKGRGARPPAVGRGKMSSRLAVAGGLRRAVCFGGLSIFF